MHHLKIERWVAPVVEFFSCSVFCCALLCVHSGSSCLGRKSWSLLVRLSSCVSCLVVVVNTYPFTLSIYDLKLRLHFQVDNYSNCLFYCDYVLSVIYFIKRDKLFTHQH